jgi:hypothetical protein
LQPLALVRSHEFGRHRFLYGSAWIHSIASLIASWAGAKRAPFARSPLLVLVPGRAYKSSGLMPFGLYCVFGGGAATATSPS